jgi:Zn-dependent M28 family amino/carboxypeptidase
MSLSPSPESPSPKALSPEALSSLASRLEVRVRHLSKTIGERHVQRRTALDAAVRYLRDELRELGVPCVVQEFEVDGHGFSNLEVLAPRAPGPTPEPACIVVGAHYDTVPGTPGADDNASGVAALLELVAQLGQQHQLRSLRFVFFPNQEPLFFPDVGMGSAAYAARLRHDGVDVHLIISLEMLGYYSDRAHSQKYPPGLSLRYPDRGDFIGLVTNLSSRHRLAEVKRAFRASTAFPCESLAAPEWTVVVGLSDHRSFWREGYPALMVTDTAFLRNPHYHQDTDTADTLDYVRFAAVTAGMIAAVKRLASTI